MHDPWHPLGPLIHRFPNGPRVTGIPLESKVSLVINEHGWSWPLITDIEHMEIVDHLPRLEDSDGVRWNSTTGEFTISDAYRLFQPPGPTVGWHVLLRGLSRIPRNCFILWLAILERLSTLDRTWWTGLDSTCVLCSRGETESHSHLFFQCEYARTCLRILEAEVRFRLPRISWQHTVLWSARRWRGKHPWNAVSRALLASLVYHIWMERNKRRFGNESTIPERTAWLCIEQIQLLILGAKLKYGTTKGDPAAGVETGDDLDIENESPNVEVASLARLKSEFNITEFLALATRVIDEGDSDALRAISDLKVKWAAKFGVDAAVAPPLRPVATRPSTPFRHAVVLLHPTIRVLRLPSPDRMASILSRGKEPLPTPLITLPPRQTMREASPSSSSMLPLAIKAHEPLAVPETLTPRVLPPLMHLPSTMPPSVENPAASTLLRAICLLPSWLSFSLIAAAFHNSSRKTLSFVPPTMQNGEIVVRPSLEIVRDGYQRWSTTAVKATSNGFYFFEFKTAAAMEEVPVWIKLRHLLVELWTNEGLSTVASGIGKPLYPDAITRACTRLDFTRVCVMLDISSKFPKHIVIMVPSEDGSESACKVDVEYEWLPPKYNECMSLGHPTKECPSRKPKQSPVSAYVQKPPAPVPREQVRREPRDRKETSAGSGTDLVEREDKGDSRSLWKRLDRLLVNDCWLGAWPNTSYVSLNARTSDHSPLVLHGDVAAQALLAQDRQSPILLHLEFCCKMILRLATKLEQNMLHQRAKLAWMKGGDQCSRIFFPKTLLGGERRHRVIDLCYLRPWARYIISEAEALILVQAVTPNEIKLAVFDIDEVKAPGLDGYSSGFFKAAWPIIREEVTRAIMEFFRTGRLLKQVNSTLISLIPKVNTPTVVAEFRPISCCNVLYKIITKVIVQRMRGVLDKLISPSQNAFVPGRSIGDNILLAQELFHGYNEQQLPPRCALKVDLRKAYDTVEWDFLSAVLTLFGFPAQFISWIEECVTIPSFSVCLNGSPHGFFRGCGAYGRGTLCPHTCLCLFWRS
ncbi:UNVERIFIED_CONTAM: hypothetical protein Slati_3097800 [Sesamum latifolium]|uniref:Reverse transcriptase domain-containing protein n=1 Tax=Sesamum latifolium TaxID=2727402 RepID=A0AAW2UVH2_9LAMI